ncbi:hypothetical protein ACODT5_03090 [Streptomyces sp. 5.8]|uniref:hypothetical protein n=1 Tax=Streptomyces sp. 5.8 TaxID=3406571 RepID=UPI003BB722EA
MRTPADSRADAQRFINALPNSWPQDESRRADAVQAALLDSGLLDSADLGNTLGVVAAARDGLASLAHLLDAGTSGHGAGRLLLLLLTERARFTAEPEPDDVELSVREGATALLDLAQWHMADPFQLLGPALEVHAEEARSFAPALPVSGPDVVVVTEGLAPDKKERHLAVGPFESDALSVCGRWLDQRAEDAAGVQVPECAGCFGRAPLDPAPVFTAAEHDAWTTFIAGRRKEEA